MAYEKDIHHRRSIRLKNYDYSHRGMYFVTICTQNHECLFGKIEENEMNQNDAGRMIQTLWSEIPQFYLGFQVHEFIVMPNHVHGIIEIEKIENQGEKPLLPLSTIVQRFKSLTTKKYSDGVKQFGWVAYQDKLWHRNYYEHIIRNVEELNQIQRYILRNPINWARDRVNPTMPTMNYEEPEFINYDIE